MTSSRLILGCGAAAVAASVLLAGWGGAHILAPGHLYFVDGFCALVVPLLFSVALVGLYTKLTGRQRALGAIGLLLAGVGLFVASCGSVWGVVVPIADVTPVCIYLAERGVPRYLLDWWPYICTALLAMGVGVSNIKALGRWSLLPLAGGAIGWIFYATDSGSTVGLLLANFALGVLFDLCWLVLGLALLQHSGRQENHMVD
jgi:hypothetical protein